jgi:hypothetical protein
MPHAPGTVLDGTLACLETLRMRCVCDDVDGCWHLRTARGRPLPDDSRHVVWVAREGHMTATRAAWLFAKGKHAPKDWLIVRRCDSYDCVNPKHLRAVTRPKHGALLRKRGRTKTTAKTIAAKLNGLKRSRLTPELRRWMVESEQPSHAVAHALGVVTSHVINLRRRAREGQLWA